MLVLLWDNFMIMPTSKKSGTGTMNNPMFYNPISQAIAVNWFNRQIVSSSEYDS